MVYTLLVISEVVISETGSKSTGRAGRIFRGQMLKKTKVAQASGWLALMMACGVAVAFPACTNEVDCGGETSVLAERGCNDLGVAQGTSSSAVSGSGGTGGSMGAGGAMECDSDDDCAPKAEPCWSGSCKSGQCEFTEDNEQLCDDGLFCTAVDHCVGGTCISGAFNDCGLTDSTCSKVACDESQDACSMVAVPNGTFCTSPNLCIVGSKCQGGGCFPGTAIDCFFSPVPNECHVAVCNQSNGMCEPVVGNDGSPCYNVVQSCGGSCATGHCIC